MDSDLTRRVAALETQVSRMQLAFGGIINAISTAEHTPAQCAKCGFDPEVIDHCNVEDECPCGVPKLPTPEGE